MVADRNAPDIRRYPDARTIDYRGIRLVLGRTEREYAIWEAAGGPPLQTFPLTDEGWRIAWTTYRSRDEAGAPGPGVDEGKGTLRTLDLADVLGGAFRIPWRRRGPILGAVAALVVPFQTLFGTLSIATLEPRPAFELGGETIEILQPAPWVNGTAFVVGLAFIVPLTTVIVAFIGLSALVGEASRVGSTYRVVLRRLIPLVVVSLPLVLPIAPGYLALAFGTSFGAALALMVLGVALWVAVEGRLLFGPIALALEARTAASSWRRSWGLTAGRFWRVVGVTLLALLIVFGISLVWGFVYGLFANLRAPDRGTYVLSFVLGGLSTLVITPFLAMVSTLLYVDARVTEEAYDPEAVRRELGDRIGG